MYFCFAEWRINVRINALYVHVNGDVTVIIATTSQVTTTHNNIR